MRHGPARILRCRFALNRATSAEPGSWPVYQFQENSRQATVRDEWSSSDRVVSFARWKMTACRSKAIISSRPVTSLAIMAKLQVIVGSTRPTRAAERVFPWVVERAQRDVAFEVELLDLRDWQLPFFQEHIGTIGDFSDPTYSDPTVRAWNKKIAEGDAYLIVTAEYNHSVPGQLKNAIDNLFVSFALRNKPVGFVGYSGGIAAGTRAVEHLALIVIEAEAVPLRNSVLIPFVTNAFGEDGKPADPATGIALSITLEDLAWRSNILSRARAEGELLPGTFRARAAAAASKAD